MEKTMTMENTARESSSLEERLAALEQTCLRQSRELEEMNKRLAEMEQFDESMENGYLEFGKELENVQNALGITEDESRRCPLVLSELVEINRRLNDADEFGDYLDETYNSRCNKLSASVTKLKGENDNLFHRTDCMLNNYQFLSNKVDGLEKDLATLVFGLPCQQAPHFENNSPCAQVKPS